MYTDMLSWADYCDFCHIYTIYYSLVVPLLGSSFWWRGDLVYFSKTKIRLRCWREETVWGGANADWSDVPTVHGLEGLPRRRWAMQGRENIHQEQVL